MKLVLVCIAGLLSLTRLAGALEIPRTVHRTADIPKAMTEATAAKKGILWVYSDATMKPT